MHILGLIAENYKRLRVVEITPTTKLVQITGRNGQGKTSVLDAIWTALAGAKAMPEKPVRKGADCARIKLNLGELTVMRTVTKNGTQKLIVENKEGKPIATPQAVLDNLLGQMSFDPLEFIRMKPGQQIETLRRIIKLDVDLDELAAKNAADYEERHAINRTVKQLEVTIGNLSVQENLPKERIDEAAIMREISDADGKNKIARDQANQRNVYENAIAASVMEIEHDEAEIKRLQEKVAGHKKEVARLKKDLDAMPPVVYVEVTELTRQLQQAQVTNRELSKRDHRDQLQKDLNAAREQSDRLSRNIEQRDLRRKEAITNAKMPIDGLTFDDNSVLFNSIPIEQLGGAEQIRISTAIAMAMNPKLRIIRIMHGEELDDDNLAILTMIAEQNDFQIWMARVDTSGKVGIVMEDGSVANA